MCKWSRINALSIHHHASSKKGFIVYFVNIITLTPKLSNHSKLPTGSKDSISEKRSKKVLCFAVIRSLTSLWEFWYREILLANYLPKARFEKPIPGYFVVGRYRIHFSCTQPLAVCLCLFSQFYRHPELLAGLEVFTNGNLGQNLVGLRAVNSPRQ